ncbi:MAG TPA: hypothetical protein VHP83_07535 [Aggregatilineaceae bacterium]|nr:hypothetical protein [Aggregatilineaceae bacterium]
MKRIWVWVVVALLIGACGDKTEEGTTLQGPGSKNQPTATVQHTPVPTVSASGFTGRLLIRKGQHFEMLDLETGETTSFETEDVAAFGPVQLSADAKRGVFVAYPDFALLDLEAGEAVLMDNPGSTTLGIGISPDGKLAAGLTGGTYRTQLFYYNLDNPTPELVAGSTQTSYNWVFDTDSNLIWWAANDPTTLQKLDPATGESAPRDETEVQLASNFGLAVAPDQTRIATIPAVITQGPTGPITPTECFDSAVQIIQQPVDPADVMGDAETVYTEAGLIASAPTWLDDEHLLFVKLGNGTCGRIEGEAKREIMLLDLSTGSAPRPIAGPLGNARDQNDAAQLWGAQLGHLYSLSPDGRYVAWIGGEYDEGVSTIQVTEIETGVTTEMLRVTEDEANDAGDFIEHYLLRQVVWLAE